MQLQCLLCEKLMSASNESRIAGTHLKAGACSALKKDDELAQEVAKTLLMSSKQLSADGPLGSQYPMDPRKGGVCGQLMDLWVHSILPWPPWHAG